MQPPKNNAWTNPTLYLSPQNKPHSDTVELLEPDIHSHEPVSSPQTVFADPLQPNPAGPSRHLQSGSRSAKIMTMVWKASRAQAKLVSTKCFICQGPNSPQYLWSMSSIHNFSGLDSPSGFLAGGRRGDRRPLGSDDDVVDMICWDFIYYFGFCMEEEKVNRVMIFAWFWPFSHGKRIYLTVYICKLGIWDKQGFCCRSRTRVLLLFVTHVDGDLAVDFSINLWSVGYGPCMIWVFPFSFFKIEVSL